MDSPKQHNYKQLAEIFLLAVFFINLLAYMAFVYLYTGNLLTEEMGGMFDTLRHFSEISLSLLLGFYYISYRDRWRYSLKFLLYCLTAMWINNFPYVVLKYEVDLYFVFSSLILFIIGVILALWVLTRR